MARKLKKQDEEGKSVWLATYADMMTILFVLFVLLYSMSSINPVKWDILVQTYGNKNKSVSSVDGSHADGELSAAPDEALINYLAELIQTLETQAAEGELSEITEDMEMREAKNFDSIYMAISNYVAESGYSEMILVDKDEFEIMIRFKDKVLFSSGMAMIGPEGRDTILFIGGAIHLVLDQVEKIKVVGHTDNWPQNSWTYPNNRSLGSARANAVVDILEEAGIPTDRPIIESVSMADTDPIADNDTPEGRAENRRVEITITRARPVVSEEPVMVEDIEGGTEPAENTAAEETEGENTAD